MVSIVPVLLSASVYVNSEVDAALGGCSQHRTYFRPTFYTPALSRSLRGDMVMCMKGPSTVQEFASNARGCILRMVHKRLLGCVIGILTLPIRHR